MGATAAQEIGTIQLNNKVIVSDPCYNTDTWCTVRFNTVLPGTYICKVRFYNNTTWGKRVKELFIVHESLKDRHRSLRYEYAGNACVDSGQMGIFDYDYFEKVNENEETKDRWYNEICKTTLKYDYGIFDNLSVVSSSGYGDGSYQVFANWSKNDIRAIKIVFI